MKPAKREKASEQPAQQSAVSEYVSDLQKRFGAYARPAAETRHLVDASMGDARLSDILYESRNDS